jgi:hypothetical protein
MRSRVLAPALALGLLLAACGVNNPTYFPPATGPLEAGGMGNPAEATAVVTLAFKQPTAKQARTLDDESTARGYRVPWLRRDDVALSVLYTLTNLEMQDGTARLFINGASELSSYDRDAITAAQMMAAVRNNEAPDVLSLIEVPPVNVPAGQSVTGQVREDDFGEAELDLDAIGRWMAPPASVLINDSEVNPVGMEMVPADLVVPALFRLNVTLATTRHMRLDFLVRVRDTDGKLATGGAVAFAPMPANYTPPPPMAGP